jgi:hypothetical protein
MTAKALDLFQAYSQEKLPREGGFIVSSFFDENSAYSRYEVVAYATVKDIYLGESGLTFQTDGNKLFILVEPANYSRKHLEPVSRTTNEQIPHRFSELEIHVSKNQAKVMISKEPIITYTSFTILKPTGVDFALIFYNLEDVYETLEFFFSQTLHKEASIPATDAKQVARIVSMGLQRFSVW